MKQMTGIISISVTLDCNDSVTNEEFTKILQKQTSVDINVYNTEVQLIELSDIINVTNVCEVNI